jgi:hypothetical protein
LQPSAASISATPTKVVTETIRLLPRALGARCGDARVEGAAEVIAEGAAIEMGAADRGDAHTNGAEAGGADGSGGGEGSGVSSGIADTGATMAGCDVELLTSFGANKAENQDPQLAV